METKPTPNPETVDPERRDFLRNSVYAAYATPLITALLVEKASHVTLTLLPEVNWQVACWLREQLSQGVTEE